MKTIKGIRSALPGLAAAALCAAMPAHAVSYAMKATAFVETLPDGTPVTMWGYRLSVPNPTATQIDNLAAQTPATNTFFSPGQALIVPPGDNTLTITLINGLPAGQLTSLVIHGLVNGSNPVFATAPDASGTVCTPGTGTLADQRACRLRSLTQEAPNGGRAVYTFTDIKPGTYLYQSGTHPQVQVQMGLSGMMSKEADLVGTQRYAYGSAGAQTAPFQNEVKLIFSEIDANIHAAVAAGTFSGSTVDYQPTHYRLHRYNPGNGNPILIRSTYDSTGALTGNQTFAVPAEQPLLIRMANAGLTSRAPLLRDGHWTLVGEDAKPYPYPREQAALLLPAAKTTDALITPHVLASATTATEADIVVFDRRGGTVTTADGRLNGDYMRLRVDTVNAIPLLDLSAMSNTGTQGVAYNGSVMGSGAVAPLSYSLPQAPAGMTINASTGVITWTPTNAQAQKPATPTLVNTVVVRVDSPNGKSNTGTAYVTVANVNDAPIAAADAYTVVGGLMSTNGAAGVRANDSDPDGDALGNVAASGVLPTGLTLRNNGGFDYDVRNETWFRNLGVNASQKVTFQYTVLDANGAASLPGTVTLTVQGHKAPIANADVASFVLANRTTTPTIDIPVLANDSAEAGWTIVKNSLTKVGAPTMGATVTVVNPATGGACTASSDCVLRYKPASGAKRGTESFSYKFNDNFGRVSNTATVQVNIQ